MEFFSKRQQEFLDGAVHRWNIKTGATRSGKTYMDYYVIPKRIRACTDEGLIVLIGNTVGSLKRNVLEPMQGIWGKTLVGDVRSSDSSVRLFGRKVYVLGADKESSAKRLQGSSIQYCYGDEITTWNRAVFDMLKSRLDKPNSCVDGTCNPEAPNHWFRKFLDSDADIFELPFTLYDNPYNPADFIRNLETEYRGTVLFDRFILGRWVAAEGIIYRSFADNPMQYRMEAASVDPSALIDISIGVDFGGTASGTTFVAVGTTRGYGSVIALASERHVMELNPDSLAEKFIGFVRKILEMYGRADAAYCDNAESVLIRGLRRAAERERLPILVRNAAKTEIKDRIRLTAMLISQKRLYITKDAETLSTALSEALWDAKEQAKGDDVRLDNGTTDIDTLDAFEYAIEGKRRYLIR